MFYRVLGWMFFFQFRDYKMCPFICEIIGFYKGWSKKKLFKKVKSVGSQNFCDYFFSTSCWLYVPQEMKISSDDVESCSRKTEGAWEQILLYNNLYDCVSYAICIGIEVLGIFPYICCFSRRKYYSASTIHHYKKKKWQMIEHSSYLRC